MRGHMAQHTGVAEFKCDICLCQYRYPHDYNSKLIILDFCSITLSKKCQLFVPEIEIPDRRLNFVLEDMKGMQSC